MGILSSHNSDHQNAPILNFIWKISQNEQFIDEQTKFVNFDVFPKFQTFRSGSKLKFATYFIYLPQNLYKIVKPKPWSLLHIHVRTYVLEIVPSAIAVKVHIHWTQSARKRRMHHSNGWQIPKSVGCVCWYTVWMCVCVYAFECALGMVWIVWVCVHRCVSVLFCESLGNRR